MPSNDVCRPLEVEEWGMLLTHMQAGEYAFFVASGLSATAGLPTGVELAKRMIEKLYPRSPGPIALFRGNFGYAGELDLPAVTQSIEARYGRQKLIKYLTSCTNWNVRPYFIHDFFRLLSIEIEPRDKPMRIITSNFDDLLERSLPSSREVIVTREQYRMARNHEPWVLKVHGCIRTQPTDTIRVTTTDLRRPLESWKKTAVQSILDQRGLIVVGYGATDTNVRRIIISAIKQSVMETYWVSPAQPPRQVLDALSIKEGRFLQMDAIAFFKNLGMGESRRVVRRIRRNENDEPQRSSVNQGVKRR